MQLDEIGPVLLVIDEFGKNLEAFAERPGDGDLFLLQELAEWTRRGSGSRLALVTLQHMAFGDYADGASAMQRREWVKVQGRFEDIPFVDTSGQTISLVAASFEEMGNSQSARVEDVGKGSGGRIAFPRAYRICDPSRNLSRRVGLCIR